VAPRGCSAARSLACQAPPLKGDAPICGRMVLYQRTAATSALLAAIHADQATG